ncbi:putative E1-E2 ATPase-domain-containing protein [Seiridium cardinale]|uniref:E1-E2 ATPase-domain-containing protein n=1 Tax=Seiridium cardinale TaxID=138064 RepID=A0ABR2XEB3_9PEZI
MRMAEDPTYSDHCCTNTKDACSPIAAAENQDDSRGTCGEDCCPSDANAQRVAVADDYQNKYCSIDEGIVMGSCQERCCSGEQGDLDNKYIDKCCSIENDGPTDTYQDKCCQSDKDEGEGERKDVCCSKDIVDSNGKGQVKGCGSTEPDSKDSCKDKYCSDEPRQEEPDTVPPCCEGKQKPCCDVSCIDRLVSRECGSSDDNDEKSKSNSTKQATIRQRYADKMSALGCICRALIALGQESCCAPSKRAPTMPRRQRVSSTSSRGSKECCTQERPSNKLKKSPCSSGSGAKGKVAACKDNRCDTETVTPERSIVKGIVSENQPSPGLASKGNGRVDLDPEKGFSGKELVILSISDMTCTGCETKLQRVLGAVSAVSNLKTSLVMARTEFSLDVAAMSVGGIIKHLERTTEFKCERISTKGSTIEVMPTGDIRTFLEQTLPLGVNDMRLIGKDMVRINFDPRVIGARRLLETGLCQVAKLAPLQPDIGIAAGDKHVRNMGYITLFSSILTIPVLVLAWAPIPQHDISYGIASLVLASIVQFVVAGPFYPKALKSLIFSRVIEIDLLIVLSTSAAYIFSVISFGYLVAGKPLSTGEFFETSTLLVSLIMVGRWVGALARQRAIKSISIRSLQPSQAQLVDEDGTSVAEIDTRLLQFGDIFCVLPEHRVPTDGVIISGFSEVDESMLTGESRPIEKRVGDQVIAGSINGSGKFLVRLTRLPEENTINVIASMVDNAKLSKPRIQDLADRVASYFVPVVILLTILTFVIWIAVGLLVRKQSGSEAAIQAITFSITVLIVSCPCAIGLAVPMVIVIGSGVAAERGVIFKSAHSIEVARSATHIVFDKTGTLTQGKMTVSDAQYETDNSEMIKSEVLGLVTNSKHPVSAAVAAYLAREGSFPNPVENIQAVPGKGLEATIKGQSIRGGNSRWLDFGPEPRVAAMLAKGYTVFCVAKESRLCAIFGLSDTMRPDAATAISELKRRGILISILSGDDDNAVQEVAKNLDISFENIRSRCTPGGKQDYIKGLLETSAEEKTATVIFVGDGTNDAVALAQATVGVHMNSGTDVAGSAADVVLMGGSLNSVVTMIDISRASVRRIVFNFAWSFVYNIMAVMLASGALVAANGGSSVRIPPEYAGLGELVSVLPVIAIALGLKWSKI